MNSTFATLGILALGAAMSLPLGLSAVKDLGSKNDVYFALKDLSYDGVTAEVTQEFIVHGVKNVPAGWKAWVERDGAVVCEGESKPLGSSYSNEIPNTFTLDVWVGDKCPSPQSGDIGHATWTYERNGEPWELKGRFTIP